MERPGRCGIIYHTVKFCDYYGFEYMNIKKQDIPLLKIETDCSKQATGQIQTRIEAFAETMGLKDKVPWEGRKVKVMKQSGFVAGIDSGSTSTDAVIMNENREIVGRAIVPTGIGAAKGADHALSLALKDAGMEKNQILSVVTTGYGREHLNIQGESMTEITCHAKGARYLMAKANTIIDIGGQDSKVIRLDEEGNVVNFAMNDKCAAGTGRFLDALSRALGIGLEEMSSLGLHWKNEVSISSMCTVFAESEVVSLVAKNIPMEDIIHGLNLAVANRAFSLVKRVHGTSPYCMTGGVAANQGVVRALEEKLEEKIYIDSDAQLCGAIGAALFALESLGLKKNE